MSKPSISITADEVNCLIYSYFVDSGFNHSSFTLATEAQLDRSPYFRSKHHIRRGELVDLLSKALLYIEVETHFNNGYLGGAKCEAGFSLLDAHVCKGSSSGSGSGSGVGGTGTGTGTKTGGGTVGAGGEKDGTGVEVGAIKVTGAPPPAPVPLKVNFPPPPLPTYEVVPDGGAPSTAAPSTSHTPAYEGTPALEAASSTGTGKAGTDGKGKRKAAEGGEEARAEKRAKTAKDKPSASQAATTTTITSTTTSTSKPKKPRMLKDDFDVHPCVHLMSGHESEVFVTAWNPTHPHILASGAKNSSVILWNVPSHPLSSLPTTTSTTSTSTTSLPSTNPPPTTTTTIPPLPHPLLPTSSQTTSPLDPTRTLTLTPASTHPPSPYAPLLTMRFAPNKSADINCISWSGDGSVFAVAGYDCSLRVVGREGGVVLESYEHRDAIYGACFSPDGRHLLTASLDKTAGLWDMERKTLVRFYKSHQDCCIDVEWLDNEHFVSGGMDHKMYLHSIEGRTAIEVLGGHTAPVNQIRRSPSGCFFAAASDDGSISIWTLTPRQPLSPTPSPSSPPTITPYRPGYDSLLKRLQTRYPLSLGLSITQTPASPIFLRGHKKSIASLCWSPVRVDVRQVGTNQALVWDGSEAMRELVCSVSFDGTARVWDAEAGRCLKVLGRGVDGGSGGGAGGAGGGAGGGGGSGGGSGGEEVRGRGQVLAQAVFGVAFSPCAKFVATGGADGFVLIYSVDGPATSKLWSWYAGSVKSGVFELNWQHYDGLGDRLSLSLERKDVAVIDTSRIAELRKYKEDEELLRGQGL